MKPRLLVLAGPLKGVVLDLPGDVISIGRDPLHNQICLSDHLVSRQHCQIERRSGHFWIKDKESANGTFVNGIAVGEQELNHNQKIGIGDSIFTFLYDETELAEAVEFDEVQVHAKTTFRLKSDEVLYFQAEKAESLLLQTGRKARDLVALLRVSNATHQFSSFSALQKELLKLVFEIVPASTGIILFTPDGNLDAAALFGMHSQQNDRLRLKVNSRIAERVLREQVAILCNDIERNEVLSEELDLTQQHVCSLLAAPLIIGEESYGLIYFDAKELTVQFDEDHLHLVVAIAAIAGRALQKAHQIEVMEAEVANLRAAAGQRKGLIGTSAGIRKVQNEIARVAPNNTTVLIRGESGTGKELVALAIHQQSKRANNKFLAINCACLKDEFLESELFGHEKGSFTSAYVRKLGKLEEADKGTVFLDELGEMPVSIQAKLLRVLDTREFERLGGTKLIKTDIRLIAATNRNLEVAMKEGRFRADLYYRLNVCNISLPPLRERRTDIPILANYFVHKFNANYSRQLSGMTSETNQMLTRYDWPGNVRELEHAIEYAFIKGSTDEVRPEDLPESLQNRGGDEGNISNNYQTAVREAKKNIILQAFQQASGDAAKTANLLGIHKNNLYRLLRELDFKGDLGQS